MGMEMELKQEEGPSILLELAASDDVDTFKIAVEQMGHPVDQLGLWYTRRIGSKTMSYEQRTPLMVAAQYGSTRVLDYIINSGNSHINRLAGSDRVTALHCAVAGGSEVSSLVVDRLIAASADVNALDGNGNKASDLIPSLPKFPSKKQLKTLLNGSGGGDSDSESSKYMVSDLPDINNGVYGSDEFRMYCFKIKPCSRAYTHDWTECPFAHPGENARRRDPTKHHYTCVPCPEFKKGSCKKGEDCEFAHGVFESWLHPAQYRTRLCKDEIGCTRKVCFFAHKKEELRPVYASTGSAIPVPDMSMSPKGLTPPPSPGGGGGGMWQGKAAPPSLQLPGSRLRSSLSARDVEHHQFHHQHQHQIPIQIQSPRSSPNWRSNNLSPANLETVFASINVGRKLSLSPPDGSPKSMAAAMLNSRAAAFAKRSQSFVDRGAAANGGSLSSSMTTTNLSDWSSPNGKLEWGVQGEELNKLRKSNSFGFRGGNNNGGGGNHAAMRTSPPGFNEPDVSWVNSLVKEEAGARFLGRWRTPNYGGGGGGGEDMCLPWVEQLYIEQEQLVA